MQENTNILPLSDSFMKDYTVSSGHPENVIGGMPWNRKSKTASYSYNPFCS